MNYSAKKLRLNVTESRLLTKAGELLLEIGKFETGGLIEEVGAQSAGERVGTVVSELNGKAGQADDRQE